MYVCVLMKLQFKYQAENLKKKKIQNTNHNCEMILEEQLYFPIIYLFHCI